MTPARRTIGALALSAAALLCWSAPALAAPPEAPETKAASGVTATTATLHGVLNPEAPGEAGTYEFLYRQSSSASECEGEFVTPTTGALGGEAEAAHAEVTGLQPSTHYTFCVLARNEAGETALGSPETLTTGAAPPAADGESFSGVKATEATLEAQINPNNEKTTYTFEYSTEEKAGVLEGAIVKLPGASPLAAEFGDRLASVSTGAVLTANTTYFYRVVAENAQSKKEGKPAEGTVQSFKTSISPEKPETLKAEPVGTTTATLRGVLNPKAAGNAGTYEFLYKEGSECEGGVAIPGVEAMTGAEGQAVPPAEASELLPNATYAVCLLARNVAGETAVGLPRTFTTLPVEPTINLEATTTTNVTATSADLTANIEPQGSSLTSCEFEYGTSTSYGNVVPCEQSDAQIGSGRVAVPVSLHITEGLFANTEYHWRLVAGNAAGTSTSPDQTFVYLVTSPPPPPVTTGEPEAVNPSPGPSPFPTITPPAVIPYTTIAQLEAKEPKNNSTGPPSKLTKAQLLAKALKACRKDKKKSKRRACEKQAHSRYGKTASKASRDRRAKS